MHCISHLAYHDMYCIMLFVHCTVIYCGSLLVFLLWVEPGDEYVHEEPVEYANEDQAFDDSENFAGKMIIPSKSFLSLLASCSLYCYVALPTTCYIMPPILPCQASNPPSYQTVVWLCYRFCSSPRIVLLVAGALQVVLCWNMDMFGISNYLLFNLMHLYTW